ncbi:PREDICTED: dual specificity mitogen-activated protein kinase kinase 6-like [Amphimedon queenslandica]|uniref:mitogen-activated protein kinase kinase n=1 Tax=Amphimedon queenslandica TaxID=400682 RepID=A0A1X7VES5_AMPQE|nr:PREDICTED: dual specificity mitogen-activated protein kinase kinase 6-like [Amphimedon queenslandica]|eukprot:XP_003384504.1 PREDICTED: dual specificity mitogen-activated protein kinase kinase 6-like [Amphimedon queenslandica]
MPSKNKFKARAGAITPLKMPEVQATPKPPPSIDLPDVATVTIDNETFELSVDDLDVEEELGRGQYGQVNRMKHKPTGKIMAVKRIRATPDQAENKRLLMDYNVAMRSIDCPFTITFYGALFREGDVWICMELMDKSLDKLYQLVYKKLNEKIPEVIVGKMADSTLKALTYLHDELQVMHRDVKPSNILINKKGEIKLCDFGIAGELVNSLAKTDIGCRPYLAPERIYGGQHKYDHRSDVWSLGITLCELATGEFPYPPYRNLFEQIKLVVEGAPPQLPDDGTFSEDFRDFVSKCLTKERDERPRYEVLNGHKFIKTIESSDVNIAEWYEGVLLRESSPAPSLEKPK